MCKRILLGVGYGVVATIAMSTVRFLARKPGVFPMWKPVPLDVTMKIFGSGVREPLILLQSVAMHLAYGGFWGGVLWVITPRVTIGKGLGIGIFP